jgi:hypothetical protein
VIVAVWVSTAFDPPPHPITKAKTAEPASPAQDQQFVRMDPGNLLRPGHYERNFTPPNPPRNKPIPDQQTDVTAPSLMDPTSAQRFNPSVLRATPTAQPAEAANLYMRPVLGSSSSGANTICPSIPASPNATARTYPKRRSTYSTPDTSPSIPKPTRWQRWSVNS